VVWGGDTERLNAHHSVLNQKYAFDFVIVSDKGKTCKAEGKRNEDYRCFGEKILSPATGVVIEAVDGVRDNKPGSTNIDLLPGNMVVIKHHEGEVSVLAHLKRGSVKVRAGEKVKSGQVVGLCGNSGNSSEPHLHYHLQDKELLREGKGIKCYFRGVKIKGKTKEELTDEISPVKGDIVSSDYEFQPMEKKLR